MLGRLQFFSFEGLLVRAYGGFEHDTTVLYST